MPTINVFIIDDEKDALNALQILLHETKKVQVIKQINDPMDLFPAFIQKKPDAIFMDIRMPRIDGIELLVKIRECCPALPVIFVSAYHQHALDAVKHNAFDYLLKPVNRNELNDTINKLSSYLAVNKEKEYSSKIILNTKSETIIVNKEDIVYLKADGNYTEILTTNGEKKFVSYHMGKMSTNFHNNELARINRSIMVNKKYLISLNKRKKTCKIRYNGTELNLDVTHSFLKEFNMIIND